VLAGPISDHIFDVAVIQQHGAAPPTLYSFTVHGRYNEPAHVRARAQRPVKPGRTAPALPKDAGFPQRPFEPGASYGTAGGGGRPPGQPTTQASAGGLVPGGRGIVQRGKSLLERASDFYAAGFHDPLELARRSDPDYAELGDKALAARSHGGHLARNTATWTDEHLTPDEAIALSRVQIVNRLKEIDDREDAGRIDLIPDNSGERAQRTATINRYTAMIPPGFLQQPNVQEALRRQMQVTPASTIEIRPS
jgi:hypothetical protein